VRALPSGTLTISGSEEIRFYGLVTAFPDVTGVYGTEDKTYATQSGSNRSADSFP
jgi:hypothetical protein